jgi:hypothetical protein
MGRGIRRSCQVVAAERVQRGHGVIGRLRGFRNGGGARDFTAWASYRTDVSFQIGCC